MQAATTFQDQTGASAIEMALVLPLLLTLVFAVIDYSRFFYLRATVTAAVADGARVASMPGTTDAMVVASVNGSVSDPIYQAAGQTVAVTISPAERVAGAPVTVTAVLPFSPLILPQFLGTTLFPQTVNASATMVVEP